MDDLSCDVCVLGGGPAGAIAAIQLASLGHDVCLFEREAFPRRHVGESLSPGIWPLLKSVGLDHIIANAGFKVPGETLLCWADPQPKLVSAGAKGNGILVDRSEFDLLLLQAAKFSGVRVFQPCQVHASRDDGGWHLNPGPGTTANFSSLHSRFLIDATGRKGFFPRQSIRFSPVTVALWIHADNLSGSDMSRVEAMPDGWCWAAPLDQRKVSLMLFCDASMLRSPARQCLEKFLRSRLETTRLFRDLSRATFLGDVVAYDASCVYTTEPMGLDFIKVGEANYSLDPLSSTGVEKTMQSAIVGALAAHTLLLHPERVEVCIRFYRNRQREAVFTHSLWAADCYREVERFKGQPFWQARQRTTLESSLSIPGQIYQIDSPHATTRIHLVSDASFEEEPCIVNNEIDSRPALKCRALNRPLVFLDGIEVAPLLATITTPLTWGELLAQWSQKISKQQAGRIASWLWDRQILCKEIIS